MASEFLQQLVEEREKERKKVLASDPAYKEILEEELKKEEAIAKKTTNVSSGTKSPTSSSSKDRSFSTVMPHIKQGWSDETYKLLNRERPKNIGGADIDAELYGTGFIAGVQGGGQGVARGINATQDTIDRYVAAHDEKPLLGTANKIGWSDDTYRFLGMEKPKNITENPKIFEETKSQKEYQEKMENATGVNKFLGQVAYGAGNMIPSMAVSTINPALGLATMGLQGFGDAYDQAIEEGKSENEALAYGVLTGATNILTQKLLGGINVFGKNIISKTAGKQLNQLVSRLSKNPTVQKAFAQAGNMASEGIEEYIQAVLDPVFRNITFDENNAIDPLSMDKIEQGLLGMATSGVLNAGTSVARRTMAGIPRRSYTPAQQQTIDMLNQAGANIPVESDSFMPEQDSISSQQPTASLNERNRQPVSDQQILDDFNQWRKDNFGGAFGRISDTDMQALKDLYEEETGIHLDRALVEPEQKKDYGLSVTADNVSLPLAYHNLFSDSTVPQSSTDGNTIIDKGLPNNEKNRIDSKLVSNRLQLPFDKSYYDPTNRVAYEDETVNTNIPDFDASNLELERKGPASYSMTANNAATVIGAEPFHNPTVPQSSTDSNANISDSNVNNSGKRQYSLTDEEIELLKNAVLQKRRGFVSNTLPKAEAAGVPGMAEVRAAMSPESQYYTPESMAETQERGRELVGLYGSADRTKDVLINKMNRGAGLNSQEVAAVVELVKHFGRQGTPEGEEAAAAIAEAYAPASTDIARAMNIMKIFQQETPAGFLILADRFIQKAKTSGKDVTLTPQDKADLLSLGQVVNEWENLARLDALTRWSKMQDILEPASDKVKRWMREAQDVERQQGPANFDMAGAVTAKAMDIIANKMPSTAREKFRALQRISMLSNPKTHIRNIGGNALVAAGETMAHPISWLADQGLSRITGQKTHAAIKPQEVFRGIVEGVQKAQAEAKLGVDLDGTNKYNDDRGLYRPKAFNPELGKNRLSKGALYALDALDNAVSTLLNHGDAPFLWGYYEDALGQIMRANKVSEATPEMADAAMQSALRRVFQDENQVTKMMQGIRNAVPFIGDIIAPYVKTPTNVTKIGLEYTPIGIAEGMLKAFVGEKSLRSLQKKGIDTTSLQRHCAELIGRGSIGTVFMVLGMALRAANIGTGDEEENRNQNAFNRAIGKLPNSFKIGDTYYDLSSLQSAAVPLIAGSAIDSALTTKEKGADYWLSLIRNIAAGTMQAGNTVTDMPVLQGVQELLGGSYTEKGPGQIFLDTLTEIPTQVVPLGSLMRQIATAMDPYARDRSSDDYLEDKVINPLKAMTPGLSDDFPVRYDTLGNPQKTYEADTEAGRLVNIFLNPFNTAKDKSTPVSDEIERLFENSGNRAVFPKLAPSDVSDNKISYDTDAAARQEWNKTQGETLNEILSNLMQSEDYRNASTEEQVEMMIKAADYARENAKQGFLHSQGVDYQPSIVEDIDGAAELGISPGQYLTIKMRHDAIPSEYSDGDAQATAFSRYLDDLGLSPEQREYIDNTLGYWGSYRIQPDAYRLGLMSESAQSKWPVAQKLGMSEENFVYFYPMCSTSGGRKKADCIRDLQNAGMTPQQAQIFWDVVKTKKYDSKVN